MRAAPRTRDKNALTIDGTASLRQCIRERVILSNAAVERGNFDNAIEMDITNNLTWAIGGIRIGYAITSSGRSVPWEQDNFAVSISGGVEPGETRRVGASIRRVHSDAPSKLMANVEVLDVADPQLRQLIRDLRGFGSRWTNGFSDLPCE